MKKIAVICILVVFLLGMMVSCNKYDEDYLIASISVDGIK